MAYVIKTEYFLAKMLIKSDKTTFFRWWRGLNNWQEYKLIKIISGFKASIFALPGS
jgi:hypothetical protein